MALAGVGWAVSTSRWLAESVACLSDGAGVKILC